MNKALVGSVNFDILCRVFSILARSVGGVGKVDPMLGLCVGSRERVLDMKAVFKWVEHPLSIFFGL